LLKIVWAMAVVAYHGHSLWPAADSSKPVTWIAASFMEDLANLVESSVFCISKLQISGQWNTHAQIDGSDVMS
jgi:hypothetical protein